MLLKEYKESLKDVSPKNKITNAALAEVLNTSSQNISKRIKNGSELTTSELSKLEETFGVFVFKANNDITGNLNRRNRDFSEEYNTWGTRLEKVRMKNSLSDVDMANILEISQNKWEDILCNDADVSIHIVKKIAENFDVDLNWLFLAQPVKQVPQFEQVKDELAQRMDKMEAALRSAGILKD